MSALKKLIEHQDVDNEAEETVVERMLETLGRVDPKELEDPAVHAERCGPRFTLLGALALDNRAQGRANAKKLRQIERRILLALISSTATLGILTVFGKEKGLEIIMWIGEHLL